MPRKAKGKAQSTRGSSKESETKARSPPSVKFSTSTNPGAATPPHPDAGAPDAPNEPLAEEEASPDARRQPNPPEEKFGPSVDDTCEPSNPSSPGVGRTLADRRAALDRLKHAKVQAVRANAGQLALSEKGLNPAQGKRGKVNGFKARKLAAAQNELEAMDAEARGEDSERLAHWSYSVEETERWNAKQEAKSQTADQGAVDHGTAAERAYARKVRAFPTTRPHAARAPVGRKPSLNKPMPQGSSQGQELTSAAGDNEGQVDISPTGEMYGSHAPSAAAVDAVVEHMSSEAALRASRSRKRTADPEAEVTYINERNRHFNDRVSRFYDRYTKEIRDNLERGTAL